jgi:hypothetical protein
VTPLTCERCGYTGPSVRVRLVRYSEPTAGVVNHRIVQRTWFGTGARCVEPTDCDTRQAATGFGVKP